MTSEEKYLLLKDLCARLPYGPRIECGHASTILYSIRPDTGKINDMYNIEDVKPYLRPMSDMTEKDKLELKECIFTDWCSEHHFDYRGLIKKGLALEAPEDIYDTNK